MCIRLSKYLSTLNQRICRYFLFIDLLIPLILFVISNDTSFARVTTVVLKRPTPSLKKLILLVKPWNSIGNHTVQGAIYEMF